jgi:hypothetical protein
MTTATTPDRSGEAPLPTEPCEHLPGTYSKLRILAQRASSGVQLFHPDDMQGDLSSVPIGDLIVLCEGVKFAQGEKSARTRAAKKGKCPECSRPWTGESYCTACRARKRANYRRYVAKKKARQGGG